MKNDQKGVIWDLTSYFPEFNGPEMSAFKKKLVDDLAELKKQIMRMIDEKAFNSLTWVTLILKAESTLSRLDHISSYLSCLCAADSQSEIYGQERAQLAGVQAEYDKLEAIMVQAFKKLSKEMFEQFISVPNLKTAAHYIERLKKKSRHTMTQEEEKLTADLNVHGINAWGRLYSRVSGKLEFDMTFPDGHQERKPISQWRSLMSNKDRDIGMAAFKGGTSAWENIEDVCAAALNAIAGWRLTLQQRRKVPHFLDQALFEADISPATLQAMYAAVHEMVAVPRKIFKTKARFFGREGIWYFEREAPLPVTRNDASPISWREATGLVGRTFEDYYPALARYYRSALDNRWVESEARAGKRPGAFCTGSSFIKEERVFMTFNGTLGDVSTLAHEMGHAWHGFLLRDLRPYAQLYPMTLAETASIFAEHLVNQGLNQENLLSDEQRLLLLDAELSSAAVFLLDITVRFEFEKKFYQERQSGEVSVMRLKELMSQVQDEVFQDALLPDGIDPYFWASKLHFYITEVMFYNFPYTFGFLLARALFSLFQKQGADFLPHYEAFLKMAGSGSAERVARETMGIDITQESFWKSAIESLEKPLETYGELVNRCAPEL
jgi:oligoendopeptidase F